MNYSKKSNYNSTTNLMIKNKNCNHSKYCILFVNLVIKKTICDTTLDVYELEDRNPNTVLPSDNVLTMTDTGSLQ